MGYEHRIYIVKKNYSDDPDGTRLCFVLARFDLSKVDGLYDVFKKSNCWVYAEDGDTEIRKDMYDENLTEAPIHDVLNFINKKSSELKELGYELSMFYPMLNIFYFALKAFDKKWKGNVVCLHYRY